MGFRVSWISKEDPYSTYNPRWKKSTWVSCELNQGEEEEMEWGLGFIG